MTERATPEELSQEAAYWARTLEDFKKTPRPLPQRPGTTSISIRLPDELLTILREFARRQRLGYQTLIKLWLDDRARVEARKFLGKK